MMTNAIQMPCADFYDMIKQAAEQSFEKAVPSRQEVADAITKGVSDAMPWATDIATAIYQGTKDSVHKDSK